MVTVLKILHSLVFMILVASLGLLTVAAATGAPTRLTWMALAALMVEIGAVALARGHCPLTTLTERFGAKDGSVVSLFLPPWLAERAFAIGGATLIVSLFVLSIRLARG